MKDETTADHGRRPVEARIAVDIGRQLHNVGAKLMDGHRVEQGIVVSLEVNVVEAVRNPGRFEIQDGGDLLDLPRKPPVGLDGKDGTLPELAWQNLGDDLL
jgi:hypothetical protein